jgi:hypothetical protein
MEPTRRRVLAAAATGCGVGLAGCASVTGDGSDSDAGGSVLASVRVVNNDETAHEVHVLVERGETVAHWSSHELGTGDDESTRRLTAGWGSQPGAFTLHVRVDDADDWETFTVGSRETACYGVEARVSGDGVSLWFRQDAPGCDDGNRETESTASAASATETETQSDTKTETRSDTGTETQTDPQTATDTETAD